MIMNNGFVPVATASPNTRVADPMANAELCCDAIVRAANAGAKVVALPEVVLTSYIADDMLCHDIVLGAAEETLAEKEVITKNDLLDVPLILPERMNVQSELANWFGKDFGKLHIAFTSNLGTNAGVMALHGLGYPVSIEGAARYWRNDLVVQKRLFPELKTSTVIAWRRNIPYSPAVSRFIEELN